MTLGQSGHCVALRPEPALLAMAGPRTISPRITLGMLPGQQEH